MKRKIACFLTAIIASITLTACGDAPSNSSSVSEQVLDIPYPAELHEDLSDHLSVHAQCKYPAVFTPGVAYKAKLGDNFLWDMRTKIADLLLTNTDNYEVLENTFGDIKEISYVRNMGEITLNITDNNYLSFSTQNAGYILNTISIDSRFDTYNGDLYQKIDNLHFLSQKDAWTKIVEVLKQLEIEVSEAYECYVMDYETMKSEEKKSIEQAVSYGGKIPNAKESWSADDDCYYFTTRASWKGYPILELNTGEGVDEYNISAIYNKNGILFLSINGYYPLAEDGQTEIQSPYALIAKLQEFLNNIISEDTYELQSIELCQKATGINYQQRKANIVPVWKCDLNITPHNSNEAYTKTLLFHAATLQPIQ